MLVRQDHGHEIVGRGRQTGRPEVALPQLLVHPLGPGLGQHLGREIEAVDPADAPGLEPAPDPPGAAGQIEGAAVPAQRIVVSRSSNRRSISSWTTRS